VRKILLSVISVLAAMVFLVGYNVAPASAHQMPPGGVSQDSAYACQVWSTYGTYGYGFAQITMHNPTSCSTFSGVHVITVFGQGVEDHWCFADAAINLPNQWCNATLIQGGLVIRAVWPGTAIAMDAYPCYGPDCFVVNHHWL
jgi:hypothetical protein